MAENDSVKNRANIQLGDVAQALALLSRLPVATTGHRGIRAAWAWPVAGAIIGAIAALFALFALWLGLPSATAAAIALAAQIILTGALHEDGLADCADGFWGGYEPERRLEIMKDSAIGTYGTLALLLSVLLRWSLLSVLFATGSVFAPLVVAGALSRLPMVALMRYLDGARSQGLSASTGIPSQDTLMLSAAAAMLIAVLFSGFFAILTAVAVAIAGLVTARIAIAKIGGQTGDVLGASQQLAEIAALAALVTALS